MILIHVLNSYLPQAHGLGKKKKKKPLLMHTIDTRPQFVYNLHIYHTPQAHGLGKKKEKKMPAVTRRIPCCPVFFLFGFASLCMAPVLQGTAVPHSGGGQAGLRFFSFFSLVVFLFVTCTLVLWALQGTAVLHSFFVFVFCSCGCCKRPRIHSFL